jgi:hypothetical protein
LPSTGLPQKSGGDDVQPDIPDSRNFFRNTRDFFDHLRFDEVVEQLQNPAAFSTLPAEKFAGRSLSSY